VRYRRKNQRGFTLIELLVVVSLIIIVVGVSGDIVVSLIRSYNKTQITNEVEQNANFVMTKLEKELRNASAVTSLTSTDLVFTRGLPTGSLETITYTIKSDGTITRQITGSGLGKVLLINNSTPDGVYLDPDASFFTDETVAGGPTVVKINLSFRQIGTPTVQFTQNVDLESTIVVRGSY